MSNLVSLAADETVRVEKLLSDLSVLNEQRKALADATKEKHDELAAILRPVLMERLAESGRFHGAFRFEVQGLPDAKLEVAMRQTVSYDSEKLATIAAGMHEDDAGEIFKVALTIPEAVFKDLVEMDHPALPAIRLARTEKLSPIAVKIL